MEETKKKLSNLFDGDNIRNHVSFNMYKNNIGGKEGLLKALDVEESVGVKSDSIKKRIKDFDSNAPPKIQVKSLWQLIMEQFEDAILKVLLLAATVSLVIGIWKDGIEEGWLEGVTIYIAVVVIVSVSAGNNYFKDRQFRELMEQRGERNVSVRRDGDTASVSIYKLVVGDYVYINTGDLMPVDCILISGSNMRADESSQTGEPDEIPKSPVEADTVEPVNSFLLSGSQIKDGKGCAIVCAVGKNSALGKIRDNLIEEPQPTPLQKKLERIADGIGKLGLYSAFITMIAMTLNMVYHNWGGEWVLKETCKELVNFLIVGITIVVVAVPEGLPLAVTISLAYSVGRMKDENNLVRQLQSCETMGGSNNVCSDKTGTLTKNRMTVVATYFEDRIETDSLPHIPMENSTKELFSENSCLNSTSFLLPSKEEGKEEERVGSATECALLVLCRQLGIDYRDVRKDSEEVLGIPFSSKRKRMTCVVKKSRMVLRIYTKGASEIVLNLCTKYIGADGKVLPLNERKKEEMEHKVIHKFADQAFRTVCLAYKEHDTFSFNPKQYENNEEQQEQLETGLTLIGIVGIQDPHRDDVPAAIKKCHEAGIIVRMVTGDNIMTAKAIARNVGILTPEDETKEFSCIEGAFFREYVGGLKEVVLKDAKGHDKKEKRVKYLGKFRDITKNLKVMARSSPEDKYVLITGLKEGDENVVAVTGDGTNDAPALKKADVGFAMGIAGTEVAKEAADIILMDDNFSSIVTAAKWGRNIYQCIRKFLQFQLTVNIVAIFTAFIGGCLLGESPLTSVQMLWVNLIMDTFASLALATEPPSEDLLKEPPYSKTESIITPPMWRNIICQAFYQMGILCMLLFGMHLIPQEYIGEVKIKDHSVKTEPETDEEKMKGLVHYTIVFHTFVFMQVFNEINARKIKASEYNIFSKFFNNFLFIFIIIFTIGIQCLLVQYGGFSVKCSPLTLQQHGFCIVIGAFSIIFGLFSKLIVPVALFRIKINEKEMTTDERWNSVITIVKKKSIVAQTRSQKRLHKGVSKIKQLAKMGQLKGFQKKLAALDKKKDK